MDIKPQNILVAYLDTMKLKTTKSYMCKLCDFGSSLNTEEGIDENDVLNRVVFLFFIFKFNFRIFLINIQIKKIENIFYHREQYVICHQKL